MIHSTTSELFSTHTMDYIDVATSGTLSPHVLPVVGLQRMLKYIADTLPPTLHLPIHQKIPYISTDTCILVS